MSNASYGGTLGHVGLDIYYDDGNSDSSKKDKSNRPRYECYGVLFVPDYACEGAFNEMIRVRRGYEGELHFASLRKHRDKINAVSRCLQLYFQKLHFYCPFSCFVVDAQHEGLNIEGLIADHSYGFMVSEAIRHGYRSFYDRHDEATVALYADGQEDSAHLFNSLPNLLSNYDPATSNPEHNLPFKSLGFLLIARGRYGVLQLEKMPFKSVSSVKMVDNNPRKYSDDPAMRMHSEFIQLTDLLVSLTAATVNKITNTGEQSDNDIKVQLRDIMRTWLDDLEFRMRFSIEFLPPPDISSPLADIHFGTQLNRAMPSYDITDNPSSKRRRRRAE